MIIKSLEQLNSFVENNLALYARDRNFDFGPDKRTNTSCLSPYVTHGVLSEKEIIKEAIKKFPFSKIEKFIQEVLWRTYWKGWLERRPSLWTDFLTSLYHLKNLLQILKKEWKYKSFLSPLLISLI